MKGRDFSCVVPVFSLGTISNPNIIYSLLAIKLSSLCHVRTQNNLEKGLFLSCETFDIRLILTPTTPPLENISVIKETK